MGTTVLKATFGQCREHHINVLTYQMCVRTLFNSSDRLSYKDIELATKITSSNLKSNNLIEDIFFVNKKFTNPFYKIEVGTVTLEKESESEFEETVQRVEEPHKHTIDAAIVRMMKWERIMEHDKLLVEVTKQLQSWLMPNLLS
ncbi:hypothetical protein AMTR_s00063p00104730 [Amborella trichopoda]|uniref:Cullin family profile domain-containing protein n=1 Tax=Amborella trichopoda TaxID=13333 RepID=U5CSL4_AMBTC|nr:hypothetical protein AMTR_s00063p00104730 [Amborella trichopoda]